MEENKKSNYSYELQEVLSYMIDILVNEFPTDVFTPEYLIVSILDTKKCHANMFLDNYLMSNSMDELRDVYTSVLRDNNKPLVNPINKEDIKFNDELNRIMDGAEYETNLLGSNVVGTEHVLLSILNPKNNFKIHEIFNTAGIDYSLILDKCRGAKKIHRGGKRQNFINNNGFGEDNPVIQLKSEVNTSASVSSAGEYITKYTININEKVRRGEIDEIVGREKEIKQMIKALARRRKNNVILVGASGVGKTSIVYGLAMMIERGEVPSILEGKEIVELNVMTLMSGTHFRGTLEERVNGLFTELSNNQKYIFFIDDIQSVMKSGSKEKDSDISGMLGDVLSGGNVRVIGTTNFKEYRNAIENNPAISNKLQRIIIEPSTVDETIIILNNNKKYYEDYHNVEFNEGAIRKCAELSERYITTRCLPDSAFDIIDLAGAYASLAASDCYEYSDLKKRLSELEIEKNTVLNNGEFEKIDALLIEEDDIKRRLFNFKKKEKEKKNKTIVTAEDISITVSDVTNIPISKLNRNDKERISNIDERLMENIVGQDEAIKEICKAIKRNKVGLNSKSKVLLSAMLLGKSGTGKTLLAKKLAEEIFGDEKAIIRIDMSEYSERSSVAKLHGCFTPDMNVLMSDGGYKKISDVEIGDSVITHTGSIKKVLNKFEYYIEEDINNIYPSNTNFKIRCTKGHNILSIKPSIMGNGRIDKKSYSINNAKFIESDKLVKDDILLYPQKLNINEKDVTFDLVEYINKNAKYTFDDKYIYSTKKVNRFVKFDEKLARIIGYYISEGGVSKSFKNIHFSFNINEKEYIDEIISLMEEVFGINDFSLAINESRHSTTINFYSRAVCKFIEKLCGRECHIKHLPKEVLSVNNSIKINLLETALFGDGTKCMVKQTKYTTVSMKLASQINTLFRMLGYSTQLVAEEHTNESYHTTYRVILTGKNVEKLNEEFPSLRIKSYEVKPKNIQRKYYMDDEYFYYRINKKETEYYSGLVYDLTIEDDSSYIVNGFSVHNSSPGYIGYEDGGVLTNSIKNKPYSIVLLDEIEKADESIYNLFLQVFDEGRLTESNGNVVDCKNCIFIMTSNVGARQASELGGGVGFVTDESVNKRSIIEKQLKGKFTPEFLNRIDKIVYFNDLSDNNLKDIVSLEINKFNKRLNEIKFDLKYDDSVVDFIHKEALKQKEYGARPIIRLIQDNIEDAITDLILKNDYEPEYTFSATCSGNSIKVS